jgi:multidrug resistance efflux pump
MTQTFLGEGVVRSQPILVPIVPMGRITSIKVGDGDSVKKGQLIAEIDPVRARINLEAARAALEIAKAELKRTEIGSNYLIRFERPRIEAILLDVSRKQLDVQKSLLAVLGKFNDKGFASTFQTIQAKLGMLESELQSRTAEVTLDMATRGLEQSKSIAAETIRTAELALELRQLEEADYKVTSPVDGVVERCLVQEGEYNTAVGNPGFLVTTGCWFEAQFDQVCYGQFSTGGRAEVHLEAIPGQVLDGEIVKIHPYVSYNLGGPETTRPIRPLGTGAPEWPATFAVRIQLDDASNPARPVVVPGQTGFARVSLATQCLAVDRAAVTSISAGKGMVYVVDGDRFRPRQVSLGAIDGDWIEIRDGLASHEEIIVDGHFALMPDDRITVVRHDEGGG